MPEIGTSGLMSGDGKRGGGNVASAPASILDSTAEKGSKDFTKVYLRRLAILLGIGLIHFTCFWWGDVLHVYASLGFLLFLFRKSAQKTILIWAFGFALLPMVSTFGYFTFVAVKERFATEADRTKEAQKKKENEAKRPERRQNFREELDRNKVAMATGTIKEVFIERFKEDRRQLPGELGWGVEPEFRS